MVLETAWVREKLPGQAGDWAAVWEEDSQAVAHPFDQWFDWLLSLGVRFECVDRPSKMGRQLR